MAKFVLAGKAGCTSYARAEMLADKLMANLPDFKVHKIVISPEDWGSWVEEKCAQNGWSHSYISSPLIWRELLDRGGSGYYLGGTSEFEDYSSRYYDMVPETTPSLEASIANENMEAFESSKLEAIENKPIPPLRVCITHASAPIAYQLAPLLLTQKTFGDKKLHLILYDSNEEDNYDMLQGMAMELLDLAMPNLASVQLTHSIDEAFKAVSVVFIFDYIEVGPSSITSELSTQIGQMYMKYAGILDYSADKDVKVIATGPYANIGVTLMSNTVSSIDKRQFVASGTLAEYHTSSIIASKLKVSTADIERVGIWGSCEGHMMVPDHTHTLVRNFQGSIVGRDEFSLPLKQCLFDKKWLQHDLINLLATKNNERRSPLVEAIGLSRVMGSWWAGDGRWHSVGVAFDDVAICRPCYCRGNGTWEKIEGMEMSEQIIELIGKLTEEIQTELGKINQNI